MHRYVTKLKQKLESNPNFSRAHLTLDTAGYVKNRQIFIDDEENKLEVYLKTATDIYYGLTPYETRKFTFEYPKKNNKIMPESWHTKLMAGEDWLGNFLKRHPSLSIRSPQATSLFRATSFNKKNVSEFFVNLKTVYERFNLSPRDIWNVDETGLTTYLFMCLIVIPRRGIKNLGKMSSAERGTSVTIAVAISALGNMVPAIFVFPRVNFKDHFLNAGPQGSEGDANPSGWMKE